ncbi:putative peptidase [Paenibacillus sp. 598K]|uniref:HK97 family phage prohead protease n=1 Tax=Paenibacillus sp. 598K TaxID=1117987 RepID=UPI000FF96F5E|nr:HK97 family phage prohead protease [Paenibacillus sp. 598K]GBF78264.1 putative peptidase [Paenibacillus sp. 598K]
MNQYESVTSRAYRNLYNSSLSIRNASGENVISGLAIPYNVWTRINTVKGETFMERIQRGALKETLLADHKIECLVRHQAEHHLGDTRSNLKLFHREDGLYFELVADNDRALHLIDGVRTGFFNKCSFSFSKQDWVDEQLGGMTWRTIKSMELYEISLVDSPAYKSTKAGTGDASANDNTTMRNIEGIKFAVRR